ncbi:MAG: acyl-CoA dehydrogenase [Hyphomonas sp.]|uniref:acyl-CoA dehydrogenase family protein n=1 Tax=Hyphomonas sp. TaxID=87 RepID=UPI0017C1B7E3|nr:acyl-CoA dehydrogenase family protein [Hyphomonas sp.]MBU3919043.1 acyl-CoA dehydrogenase family protein [Alphaproteobacteria bacterium]MBA3069306.1 acyl-CoA dehydrogenase [Hyphomonas sp.]MBU4063687.1 acyl-CoA dehydrogenase family protein [Alphaproteobacteria bacterium]MBU4164352.1 acyl-CoA dehydrogenase family protein [Alphaproteobacteria bacterium]MBU4569036.1 acyl-CoA dehydrogenase family protein [Alphaproteobacteria bacterium]
MAYDTAEQLEAFRLETRKWLEANCPPSMRTPMPDDEIVWGGRNATFKNPESKLWLDRMGEKGWTSPQWPKEYGGGGLNREEARVLEQELRRIKARPPLFSFGLWMFGPALLEFGNHEQKLRFIPDILKGKIRWCQGYSEPGAGSDLAGLQTRCEDKGDHYLINGQKVWTSYADKADWIFCLVRTDTSTKHEGISFILFDMKSPGVEARPIQLISGESPFCETFFTDVKVPKDQLVGRVNGGWEIAKRLLQFERSSISAGGFGGTGGSGILGPDDYAKQHIGTDESGRLLDGDLRGRITDHKMYVKAFSLTVQRQTEQAKAGQAVGHTASILKYAAAKMNQDRHELLIEALGTEGLGWEGEGFDKNAKKVTRQWLRSKGNSIEGGTSEINLNVIAKRVLGLKDHQ